MAPAPAPSRCLSSLDDVTDVTSDLSQSVPRISVKADSGAAAAGFDDQTLGAAVAQAVRGTPAARGGGGGGALGGPAASPPWGAAPRGPPAKASRVSRSPLVSVGRISSVT
ncbi:hypothetical protein ACFWH4_22500, partial [Streptomyces sp. NPDC127091]|uniref:hypothetical protein n=1 Tax=Streptomyces sp. NPDC127091 TaxID=3347134 RepID=UPI00366197A0